MRLCSFRLRTPTDDDVLSSEKALARVRQDLATRRADLQRRESSQNSPDPGWFSKVAVNFRGGSGRSPLGVERRRLTQSESSGSAQELRGLEALEYQMSKNLEVLRQRRENARFSATLKGRAFAIVGHGFAVYCVFRIISVSANTPNSELLFTNNTPQSVANLVGPVRSSDSTSTSSDMVTQLVVYGVSLFPSFNLPGDQVASVARQVSLVLIGAIILSSLRQLMSGVKRACLVLRVSGTRRGVYKEFCSRCSELPTETLAPR